jgi:hypothetical protein
MQPVIIIGVLKRPYFEQLYENVDQVDREWFNNKDVNDPQGYHQTDFSGYPLLAKYLEVLVFKPTSVLNPPLGYSRSSPDDVARTSDIPIYGNYGHPTLPINRIRCYFM